MISSWIQCVCLSIVYLLSIEQTVLFDCIKYLKKTFVSATYMDALTQTGILVLAVVLDVDQLDVLMADNGSKTFLYLR